MAETIECPKCKGKNSKTLEKCTCVDYGIADKGCVVCKGTGKAPCYTCDGSGRVLKPGPRP